MQKDGIEPEMPPIETPHLLGYLWEIGPTLLGNMGDSPLTQQELRAWQENIGIELEAWETRLLVRLSKDYLGMSRMATKPNCPAPYNPETYVPNRLAVAMDMKASIKRLANM